MRYQSIFLCIILKLIIIQASIMINCRNAGLNYHKFQSIIYVSNSGSSYENYPILNAYNFLYKIYFKNLTGNLIELISKNKITSLFSHNFIFLKYTHLPKVSGQFQKLTFKLQYLTIQ